MTDSNVELVKGFVEVLEGINAGQQEILRSVKENESSMERVWKAWARVQTAVLELKRDVQEMVDDNKKK